MLTHRLRRPAASTPAYRASRGQALVEFAIVIPIFLALLFGIVDLGRVVWANNSLANAAREAARYAIVHGGAFANPCPVGPLSPEGNVEAVPSATCPYPSTLGSPNVQSIHDTALAYAHAGGTDITVEVCYGSGCSGNTHTGNNSRGTPVTVKVSSRVPIFVGSLLGLGDFGVSGSSTMLVNW